MALVVPTFLDVMRPILYLGALVLFPSITFCLVMILRDVFNDSAYNYSFKREKRNKEDISYAKEPVYVVDHREENENKYSKGDSEMMKRVFKQNNSVSINQSGSNSYQREMSKKSNKRTSSSGSSSSNNSSVLLGMAVGLAVASSYYSDSGSSSSSSSYDSGSSCSHDSGSSFDCGGW
ncbi:hypothetical protein [Bacillus luti]|uniref:Uncharacterized protein n=1 Tax=Bacillus luti TaxID=2026191 RepID=A0A7V7SBA9_9BACI|nr:hypothetical protein [Bacillus luti]KAB2445233.1 hypothetical protein F8163_02720 [Bacillus luti]